MVLCELFAELGVRGVSILVASNSAGVGLGNCKDTQGNVQFYTSFPASCMCGVYLLCTQAQVQVAHQSVVILQVPGSLVLVVRC
jgi:hypothetical protein